MTTPSSRVAGEHLKKYDPRRSAEEQQEHLSVGARAEALPKPTFLRRMIGLFAGLAGAGLIYLLMPGDLDVWPRLTAATAVLMAVWWMTEAIPIPATALVPLVVFPVLVPAAETGDAPVTVDSIGANYGHNIIFLFMGGFMLALAMQRWNLHRRIALLTLSVMGSKPVNLIGGFMIATAFLSMWVSNTATAVMMLPIGLSVLMLVNRIAQGEDPESASAESDGADPAQTAQAVKSKFGTALMLGIAYAASVGSVSTIIGTPPNALLVGHMAANHDVTIGFGEWMLVGVPIALVMLVLVWLVLTRFLFRPEIERIPGGRDLIRRELDKLGPMSSGELRVLLLFVAAATAWVFVPVVSEFMFGMEEPLISDAGIAMTVGILLFLLPGGAARGGRLLDWEYAAKLPWGVLLLFGGGLALSSQFSGSGLSAWMGEQMEGLNTVPVWVLVLIAVAGVLLLTEMTSNTATTATFLPVASGVAMGTGVDPLVLAAPVALAATCAFMLPVATPPNAIAYGSGYVTIGQMVKGGLWLNVAAVVLITLVSMTLLLWVFGLSL